MKTLLCAITACALAITSAGAQTPRPLELGIDAGITIGLDDDAVTLISIPVQDFRIGFPISPRTSLEPKFGINIITGNGDTFSTYAAELGLLYHLGTSRYPGAYQRAGVYLRPFVGLIGFSDGDDSETEAVLGAGIGYKFPIVSRLSSRFEANFAHQFGDAEANRIGLLAGLSFFTR